MIVLKQLCRSVVWLDLVLVVFISSYYVFLLQAARIVSNVFDFLGEAQYTCTRYIHMCVCGA